MEASFSAVSWGDARVDLFGLAPDSSIWHKFYTGWDWQPASCFEKLPSSDVGAVSASSWGKGRLDIVFVNATGGNVLHKYYGGGKWGPSWETAADLGGHVTSVTSGSWGENRLDIVAKLGNSFVHKAWTGTEWFPSDSAWENFGGDFSSDPVVTSWGPGRLDIIGISSDGGSILHKFWHEGWSKWEDLGGGPFVKMPKVTSWGPGRLDFWAIDEEGKLNHLYWDGSQYQGWETLGGSFSHVPQVVHWNATKIDIVGKEGSTYRLKSFDGSEWHPSKDGWYDLASDFESEPSVVARRSTSKSHQHLLCMVDWN